MRCGYHLRRTKEKLKSNNIEIDIQSWSKVLGTELPLTELPVVSYCYQIIVLSKYSLTPSPLSPQVNVELNMYEVFSLTATLSRGHEI